MTNIVNKNKYYFGSLIVILFAGALVWMYWKEPIKKQAQTIPQTTTTSTNAPASTDTRATTTKAAVVDTSKIDILAIANNDASLRDTLKQIGIQAAMQRLITQTSGGSTLDCHQQAHAIGRVGYELFKEKAFQLCSPECHSGCYHGAMEWFLTEKGTLNLAKNIESVCNLFETNFGLFECLHGVGHGVLAYEDYDLPTTLKECGNLKDSFSQTSCYGGAFMENIVTGQGLGVGKADHTTPWVNKTDPLFPCDKIDQSYDIQYQCYQMQTSWMLTLSGYNFDTVAKQCLTAPTNMIAVCFKSFGRDAAGNSLRDPKKIVNLCAKVPSENGYYDQCVIGAVNVIIDFWGPGLKGQASELCSMLTENGKQICYSTVAGRLGGLFKVPDQRIAVCKTFEQKYQNLCGL